MGSAWTLIDSLDTKESGDHVVVRLTYAMPMGHGLLVHIRESKGGNSAIAVSTTFVPGVGLAGREVVRNTGGGHV